MRNFIVASTLLLLSGVANALVIVNTTPVPVVVPVPVPEPASLALFGLGLIGLFFSRGRKSK